jgi:hypothetical protein
MVSPQTAIFVREHQDRLVNEAMCPANTDRCKMALTAER